MEHSQLKEGDSVTIYNGYFGADLGKDEVFLRKVPGLPDYYEQVPIVIKSCSLRALVKNLGKCPNLVFYSVKKAEIVSSDGKLKVSIQKFLPKG